MLLEVLEVLNPGPCAPLPQTSPKAFNPHISSAGTKPIAIGQGELIELLLGETFRPPPLNVEGIMGASKHEGLLPSVRPKVSWRDPCHLNNGEELSENTNLGPITVANV